MNTKREPKVFDPTTIQKELAPFTVEYLTGDGKIHKKILSKADLRAAEATARLNGPVDEYLHLVKGG